MSVIHTARVRRPEENFDDPKRGETDLKPNVELARVRGLDMYNHGRHPSAAADQRKVELLCDDEDNIIFKDPNVRNTRRTYPYLTGGFNRLKDLADGRISRPDYRKSFGINCQCGTTNPWGIATSSALAEGSASSYMDEETSWTSYASDPVTGVGGVRTANFQVVRLAHSPLFVAKVKTNTSMDDMRIWAGFFSEAPSGEGGAPYHVALRYSSFTKNAYDRIGWMGSVKDGINHVTTDILKDAAGETSYLLYIYVDAVARKAHFSVDYGSKDYTLAEFPWVEGRETVLSASLPINTKDLGLAVRVEDASLMSRSVRISRVFCEHN